MENSVKYVRKNMLNARRRLLFNVQVSNTCCYGNKKVCSVLTLTTSIILFFAMLLAPMTVHAGGGTFGGGDGTINTPYIIEDADDLDAVRNVLYLNLHYKLGNDIDLTDYLSGAPSATYPSGGPGFAAWGAAGWMPIGHDNTDAFTGSLDGAGKKITGLWINRTTDHVGLFGYTNDAVFENLGVEIAAAGVKGADYTGGLVGMNNTFSSNCSISNCYVTGNISSGSNGIGGLVGRQYAHQNHTNSIKNCYAICDINAGSNVGFYVGILVGMQSTNIEGNCIIENCFASGSATGNVGIGGLVGHQNAGSSSGPEIGGTIEIKNCYSTGTVYGRTEVGGIVGYQRAGWGNSSISNCYSTGMISSINDISGGIVGLQEANNSMSCSITNCCTTSNIIGSSQVFGLVGNQVAVPGSTSNIANCFRYQFATVNGAVIDPLSDPNHGRALRHGDVTTTAVDFMTQATYSTNGWTFGPWYWNNSEKFPKLNFGPEVYPFPFFAITYYPDGGVLPVDAHYSYVPGETYTLPTLTKPKYIFDGWADGSNTLVSGIIPSTTGHQDFWAKWTQYIFDITITPNANGSVVADKILAQAGETITLTVTPNAGYFLDSVIVHRTGDASVIVATSAGANNIFTFTMPAYDVTVRTVFKPFTYAVTVQTLSNSGYITTDKTVAATDETVTVTIFPYTGSGWELLRIYAYNSLSPTTVFSVNGSGNTRTFRMPGYPVTVTAIFHNPTYEAAWQAALAIIEKANFDVLQKDANTSAELRYRLLETINQLIAATGFVVYANDIVIFDYNFLPAITGDNTKLSGTNGFFEFRVSPPDTHTSAYNKGTISVTAFDPTGNDDIPQVKSLIAWTQNSQLFVNGLLIGQSWCVYNMEGALVYQGIASDNKAVISLPDRGLYIVLSGDRMIKIIN